MRQTTRHRLLVFTIAVLLTPLAMLHGQSVPDAIASAPLIQPQPDGVLVLNIEAAAIVKGTGKQALFVNGGGGMLQVDRGRITRWAGDSERPTWRVKIASSGLFRAIITRVTPPGREGVASIQFSGQRRGAVTRRIETSGGGDKSQPFEMGEINLDAGEYVVEFRPVSWTSPFEFSQLADIRLIPLDPLRQTARGGNDAIRKLDIDRLPPVAELVAKVGKLQQELDVLNQESRRRDFTGFTDYQQFLDHDRIPQRLARIEIQARQLGRELDALRRTKAIDRIEQLTPADRSCLTAYADAVAAIEKAETREYPKVVFTVQDLAATKSATLFATGDFEKLPRQAIEMPASPIVLPIPPPPDAAARRKRFHQRNSDTEIAILCDRLRKAIQPGTIGLESFERHCAAGRHRDALQAYRAYFFDKLAHPEKYGAVQQNILFELTRDRGKGHLLYAPNPAVLERNLSNVAVVVVQKDVVVADVGAPGAVSWVPYGLQLPDGVRVTRSFNTDPFWRTEPGKEAARSLEFYRCLTVLPSDRGEYQSGGFFPALFFSYAVAGNKAHLARWCEYADDWSMNAKRDEEDFPVSIRFATELEPQQVRATLTFLRIVLDERPELATDFDAATLARFVLRLTTNYTPYAIRARRAEMANWGIMALCHQVHLGRFFHEFKAMNYCNRESWRLWHANMIQHQTLDGENFEAWDDGHNYVNIGFALDSLPFGKLPPDMDAMDMDILWDHIRVDERSKLVHISPGGNYWPVWEARQAPSRNTIAARCRQPDALNRYYLDLIDAEPGARDRLETIMGAGHPTGTHLPDRYSDISSYAAMYYLRESWQPEADYLILQNCRQRSQGQESCSRTMYSLSKADRVLVEAHGLVVDRKPDNRYYGKVATGGKTDFCGQAGRQVTTDRFHTSATFDFAEAKQDAPYARHRHAYRDILGLYKETRATDDPEAITDVTALRQVFGLRSEGLWFVCDRIESRSDKDREYTQFYTFPVRLEQTGLADRVRLLRSSATTLVETDPTLGRIRTSNPGYENVSLYLFGPTELRYANVLNAKGDHDLLTKPPLDNVHTALQGGKSPEAILKQPLQHPVSVRFHSKGNQVFLAALCTRSAEDKFSQIKANDVCEITRFAGDDGVMGCRGVTRSGLRTWFQSGPKPLNRLTCGLVTAEAESLLVLARNDGTWRGLILGCAAWTVAGKAAARPVPDFEFEIDPRAVVCRLEPIHRPLDTVRILPQQNVFTERIEVSFDIPTQQTDDVEFRYTLDGREPTIESQLFTKPFTLDRTTLVKVRPFRKGLTATPWHFTGTESGKTIAAIFRQQRPLTATIKEPTEPGLHYMYFEGDWPTLFSYAGFPGVLTPQRTGRVTSLLDAVELAKLRATDRAFAVRYDGFLKVPTTGVYTFFAPQHLYTATMDAGYDLRVFIDDREWLPSPTLHAENMWCIALEAGLHRMQVAYTDYRWKRFRNEYWMAWQEEEMWQGVPVLEIAGPGVTRQPLPSSWVRRSSMAP